MTTRIAALFAAILAASAQGETVTWRLLEPIDAQSGDGDGVLERFDYDGDGTWDFTEGPARILLGADMDPSVGELTSEGDKVIGYAGTTFDVLGISEWSSGTVTWTPNDVLTFVAGRRGETLPNQDIVGLAVFQLWPQVFSTADPIWVVDIRWETSDYTDRTVSFETVTHSLLGEGDPEGTSRVWVQSPGMEPLPVIWGTADSAFSFEVREVVIPSPGSTVGIALLVTLVAKRRR